MLQCTAVTRIPLGEVTVALVTLAGEPGTPPDGFTLDHYVLCELGEHDTLTDHAALLSAAAEPNRPALWFFWTGTDTDRTHHIRAEPWCPATLRNLDTDALLQCSFFNDHTIGHSWDVTDPLGDLIAGALSSDNASGDSRERPQP
ncbi:hypothetical protein ACTFBT_27080 [Streptomyces microflavus]|uniref:Uncharacterized protein n=1 Tax=Streptomyces microflavus TaxID=1919 RepID=A0A7J0CXA5_STRMI|nr:MULTISPECIES: hypothetical protein [Streptomyces]MDX2975320.1 hypothetical protein [Streptomyces sp. NRRL_B-2249]WSS34115.1 hypothetical protein OG269_11785 [Streptomyces microflavus]WST17319.1 hypothetical protein OG721_26760 [Streptomyces microflavus]SCK08631.1 hypothetical protein YUYDRAFT_00527 [Streptomyces sp. ScaeMP-e48]GFN07018.1 hypothetical protein Smic_55740 [Streptomyces microflavus]